MIILSIYWWEEKYKWGKSVRRERNKIPGACYRIEEKNQVSGRESIAEQVADWLIEGFKQQLSLPPDLEDVDVARHE